MNASHSVLKWMERPDWWAGIAQLEVSAPVYLFVFDYLQSSGPVQLDHAFCFSEVRGLVPDLSGKKIKEVIHGHCKSLYMLIKITSMVFVSLN